MKSIQTTVFGILTILAALCAVGKALLDGDPTTVPDYAILATAITTGLGLIRARDNHVTSKQAGAE